MNAPCQNFALSLHAVTAVFHIVQFSSVYIIAHITVVKHVAYVNLPQAIESIGKPHIVRLHAQRSLLDHVSKRNAYSLAAAGSQSH